MEIPTLFGFLLFSIATGNVLAQVLAKGGGVEYGTLGLSTNCVAALNTTISCASGLVTQSSPDSLGELLSAEQLSALCVAGCRADLVSVRSKILAACDTGKDKMIFANVAYPATYIADRYLFAYDVSCYTDKATGRYCDLIVADARNLSASSVDCSDCMLGVFALQLGSPIGYDSDFAADFSSATASCHASTYQYTIPGAYGSTLSPGSTTTSGAPATPTCSRTYAKSASDTCQSISQAQGVSTYGLISRNSLDLYCSKIPPTLCLPDACQTHLWSTTDTCDNVTATYGVSMANFLAWNPIFDDYCTNAGPTWANWTVCVGPPGGQAPTPSKPTAVPVPTNAKSDSNTNCAQWHTVLEGESCYTIIPVGAAITFAQFRVLNPSVDADCTNLWLGYAYCVQPVDAVAVSASTTFTRTTSATVTPTIPPTATTSLPHAPSSVPTCTAWANYDSTSTSDTGADPNTCSYVAWINGVSLAIFLSWNRSLKAGSACELSSGLSYCVGVSGDGPWTDSTTTTTSSSSTTTAGGTAPPAPTQPGAIATCKTWHTVVSSDGCWAISQQYGISLDDFYKWNPGVGTDCSALWLDYAVCVGI